MENQQIWLLIAAMAAVTYLPRCLPGLALSARPLPPWCLKLLGFAPVAVLGALLGPALAGGGAFGLHAPYAAACIPAGLVAFFTRNIGLTVVAGCLSVAVLRYLS